MIAPMISRFIAPNLNKALVIAIAVGIAVNGFLCYERKLLQAENQTARTEVALVRSDNQNLANQLERANLAVREYQAQVNALHHQILTKLQHAETRTNALLTELENHQNWRDQPVPAGVGRLLNHRKRAVSAHQTAPADLPQKPPVPNPPIPHSK